MARSDSVSQHGGSSRISNGAFLSKARAIARRWLAAGPTCVIFADLQIVSAQATGR